MEKLNIEKLIKLIRQERKNTLNCRYGYYGKKEKSNIINKDLFDSEIIKLDKYFDNKNLSILEVKLIINSYEKFLLIEQIKSLTKNGI